MNNMNDGFDEYRETLEEETVNNFLEAFGMVPLYNSTKRKTHICPVCGKSNAYYKEIHPDTDMNEIVLYCPDCLNEAEV